MLPGKKYTVAEVSRIVRQKWWLLVVPFALGTAAGVAGYVWTPPKYQADTLVMVIPRRIPDSYVKPTVTNTAQERVGIIRELIHSRTRLARIITDFNLYSGPPGLRMEDRVQQMRDDVDVDLQPNESSFRLAYTHRDPRTAQRVVERLAALVIEENVRDREYVADDANRFLEVQLEDAKRRLVEQEKKLEEYRRRHAGQLPSQQDANLQAIENARVQLQSLGESMNRARERRLLVERQVADAQAGPATVTVPGASPTSPEALPATAQLEAARAKLEQLKARYTSRHPEVLEAEDSVRALQARVEDEARRPVSEQQLSPAAIAWRKRLKDLEAERDVIDRQLASGQAEEERLKRMTAEYEVKIAALPAREAELSELMRDYTTLQESYSALLHKKEDAKVAADLERREISAQLKVLDHASLPHYPHNQRRRLAVLAGGPAGGLALGVLLLAFVEYRSVGFTREEEVVRVLSLPVLALIPAMREAGADEGVPRRRLRE